MSQIYNSQQAFHLLKPHFNPEVEEFWIILLNCLLVTEAPLLISKGTLDHCLVHPRDVFRSAIKANAFGLIMAHNHPSLQVEPSEKDIALTKRLKQISRLIEIPIFDHLIFTDKKYYSFKENKLI